MKKEAFLLVGLMIITLLSHNQVLAMSGTSGSSQYQIKKYKQAKNVEIIRKFEINKLNNTQNIWVYLPPEYEKTDKKYPVLYIFDKQPLQKSMQQLRQQETILVGLEVDNPQQNLVPWKYSTGSKYFRHPKGDKYGQFVVNKLKSYIDEHYRTLKGRKHTGVIGKDFGGLFSLYLGIRYQHVFSKVAAFSPELWVYYYGEEFKEFKIGKSDPMRFYLFTKKEETNNPAWNAVHRHNIKKFRKLLKEKKFDQVELILVDKVSGNQFKEGVNWLYK